MVELKEARQGSLRRTEPKGTPPLYQIVVKTLQSEIVRGIFPVGSLLPPEIALSERFNVSRQTVREALRALRDIGMVTSHQGLGTRVQRSGTSAGYVHHLDTISDLFPVDMQTRYEVAGRDLAPLPKWACYFPEVGQEDLWLAVTGARYKPGADVTFNEVDTFVAKRFSGVGRIVETHSGPIYSGIEMIYGETISEVEQVIGCFTADERRGARLGLCPGDKGVEVRRLFRIASDGAAAMLSFNRYSLENFSFAMTLRRVKT